MEKNKGPELYSKKSKIIIAICAALVVAAAVLCIVLISKNNSDVKDSDTAANTADITREVTSDTDDASPYKRVDTEVLTDGPEDTVPVVTDTQPADSTSAPDTVTDQPDDTTTPADTGKETVTEDTGKETSPADNGVQKRGTDLGDGITLISIEPYSGAFVEDGSDDPVEDIISIVIKNTGDKPVQMIDIGIETDNGDAQFIATTLFPNSSVVVLEKNRMKYPGSGKFGVAKINQIGRFIEEPSFYSDKFEVRGGDGTITVKNLTSEDVTGKVVVYYKTIRDGRYFGGITYQATLDGGIPAGSTVLSAANHFRIDRSRLVFVKYE